MTEIGTVLERLSAHGLLPRLTHVSTRGDGGVTVRLLADLPREQAKRVDTAALDEETLFASSQ